MAYSGTALPCLYLIVWNKSILFFKQRTRCVITDYVTVYPIHKKGRCSVLWRVNFCQILYFFPMCLFNSYNYTTQFMFWFEKSSYLIQYIVIKTFVTTSFLHVHISTCILSLESITSEESSPVTLFFRMLQSTALGFLNGTSLFCPVRMLF
jgi:hypothetical protein